MFTVGLPMRESGRPADFRFYGELNDVLPAERRKRSFAYAFHGTPAVKDAIAAIGVPHTEVDLILVNRVSVGFDNDLICEDGPMSNRRRSMSGSSMDPNKPLQRSYWPMASGRAWTPTLGTRSPRASPITASALSVLSFLTWPTAGRPGSVAHPIGNLSGGRHGWTCLSRSRPRLCSSAKSMGGRIASLIAG